MNRGHSVRGGNTNLVELLHSDQGATMLGALGPVQAFIATTG